MVCKNCQKQLSKNMKFCNNCGTPVETEETTSVEMTENEVVEEPVIMEKEKVQKKDKKFLRGFLSVVCCFLIFVLMLGISTIHIARGSLEKDKVSDLVENFELDEVIDYVPVGDFVGDKISNADIIKIYEETTIKDFVEDKVNDFAKYFKGGKQPKGIDGDDIVELVEENEYSIYELADYEVTERDYEKMYAFFDNEDSAGMLAKGAEFPTSVKVVRFALSIFALLILTVLLLLCIFWLFVIRKTKKDMFVWAGITIAISAVIVAVIVMIMPLILNLFGMYSWLESLLGSYVSGLKGIALKICGITALVGILMISLNILVNKFIESRKAIR